MRSQGTSARLTRNLKIGWWKMESQEGSIGSCLGEGDSNRKQGETW